MAVEHRIRKNGKGDTKQQGINKADKNGMWAANNVSYSGLHSWIQRNKSKPLLCECCGLCSPMDLANISGKYKRDINDYEYLCRKCHMEKDGRLKALVAVGRNNFIKATSDINKQREKGLLNVSKANRDKYGRFCSQST